MHDQLFFFRWDRTDACSDARYSMNCHEIQYTSCSHPLRWSIRSRLQNASLFLRPQRCSFGYTVIGGPGCRTHHSHGHPQFPESRTLRSHRAKPTSHFEAHVKSLTNRNDSSFLHGMRQLVVDHSLRHVRVENTTTSHAGKTAGVDLFEYSDEHFSFHALIVFILRQCNNKKTLW